MSNKLKEILLNIEHSIDDDFVTATFGNGWKEHAKENYDLEIVINIAWRQGRKAILLERQLEAVLNNDEPMIQAQIDVLKDTEQYIDEHYTFTLREKIKRLEKMLEK